MEKTVKVYEKYNEKNSRFEMEGTCPVSGCKSKNVMVDGSMTRKCRHFLREGHGCGGTVFIFKMLCLLLCFLLSNCAAPFQCSKIDTVPDSDFKTAVQWCVYDPMQDFTRDRYGNTCGWKDEDKPACYDAMKKGKSDRMVRQRDLLVQLYTSDAEPWKKQIVWDTVFPTSRRD